MSVAAAPLHSGREQRAGRPDATHKCTRGETLLLCVGMLRVCWGLQRTHARLLHSAPLWPEEAYSDGNWGCTFSSTVYTMRAHSATSWGGAARPCTASSSICNRSMGNQAMRLLK